MSRFKEEVIGNTAQLEARKERIAIITVEGVSLAEAQKICDCYPLLYGKRIENQRDIF